jgi:putative DNA primase/helicase
MNIDDIINKLQGVKKQGDGYIALCPAHDDNKQSLSIKTAEDGAILVHCHAGCSAQSIVSALRITMKDLFPSNGKSDNNIIATYNYHDAEGNLIYQVIRREGKGFTQCRPDGHGGQIWNLKGITPTIYHLPDVMKAIQEGQTIYIPEGEKDCNSLYDIGLVATTNNGGAGKWRDNLSEYLKNANVVILPDNDDPGRKHAQQVADSLKGIASSVKVLELPGLKEKGDITDWLRQDGTCERLLELAIDAPEWEQFEIDGLVSNIDSGKAFNLADATKEDFCTTIPYAYLYSLRKDRFNHDVKRDEMADAAKLVGIRNFKKRYENYVNDIRFQSAKPVGAVRTINRKMAGFRVWRLVRG